MEKEIKYKEITLLITILPPILVISFFQFQYFIPFLIFSFLSIYLSLLIISKAYSLSIDLDYYINFIVMSVVITVVLASFKIYTPIFIFPEMEFATTKLFRSIKLDNIKLFDYYLSIISLSLILVTFFSLLFSLSIFLPMGIILSFFISSLPLSSRLIGPRIIFGRPVGFILLIAYLVISFAFEALYPLVVIILSIAVFLYLYLRASK